MSPQAAVSHTPHFTASQPLRPSEHLQLSFLPLSYLQLFPSQPIFIASSSQAPDLTYSFCSSRFILSLRWGCPSLSNESSITSTHHHPFFLHTINFIIQFNFSSESGGRAARQLLRKLPFFSLLLLSDPTSPAIPHAPPPAPSTSSNYQS